MYQPPDYEIIMQHIDEMQRMATSNRTPRRARAGGKARRPGPARRLRMRLRPGRGSAGS